MKKLKKALRLLGLVALILIASMGVGAPVSFNPREKYMDKSVTIELVESKEEEDQDDFKDQE